MVKEQISLIKAKMDDWQKVLEFEKASKSKFFAALENEKEVKNYLTESQVYFVKLDDNRIGTASYKPEGNSAYMDGLTISPNQREKGYAKIAMHLIMEKVKGYKRAYLRVHPQSTSAIMVYLKEGFQITEWEDNHYGDNEPRLVMEKISKTTDKKKLANKETKTYDYGTINIRKPELAKHIGKKAKIKIIIDDKRRGLK
jgi:ribosomal protein S18 acetylase RimI-like enzyme